MRTAIFIGIAALFLAALGGCGNGVVGASQDQGEFKDLASKFEDESRSNGFELGGITRTIPIQFGETKPTEFAVCQTSDLGEPRIKVNQSQWATLSDNMKEEVIFHELGHCALGRGHIETRISLHDEDGTTEANVPESIMNPFLVPGETYHKNRKFYIRELFSTEIGVEDPT